MSEQFEIDSVYLAVQILCSPDGKHIGFVLPLDNGTHILVRADTDVVLDCVARAAQRARMGGEP